MKSASYRSSEFRCEQSIHFVVTSIRLIDEELGQEKKYFACLGGKEQGCEAYVSIAHDPLQLSQLLGNEVRASRKSEDSEYVVDNLPCLCIAYPLEIRKLAPHEGRGFIASIPQCYGALTAGGRSAEAAVKNLKRRIEKDIKHATHQRIVS